MEQRDLTWRFWTPTPENGGPAPPSPAARPSWYPSALALTDVVSSRWGGISLQSLFIDEGFGSLDPGSLDKAMAILEEIREGRCVGVISHVTEMQSRIPSRLEVLKTTTGSSVTIVEG